MLTDMEGKSSGNWRWLLLAVVLGFVHLVVVTFVELRFGPLHQLNPSNFPRYQPPWFYDAFMNVFMFPATLFVRLFPQLKEFASPIYRLLAILNFVVPLFLWGMVWAEPFRRKYGWRPWRFSIREGLAVTTAVAGVLGWLAWLSHHG